MNLSGFLKNIVHQVSQKNMLIEGLINDIFKEKIECGCFGYDCCVGFTQLASHDKSIKKGFYFDDAGDLYLGTHSQAKDIREGKPNTGTKIN